MRFTAGDRVLALLAMAAVAASGCAKDRVPASQPSSHSPSALPAVALVDDVPALPAPELSRFDVPLVYDFTEVLKTVERVVPKTFGSMNEVKRAGDDDRKHYAFEATRGPFTAFAHGSEVHLRTTLSYTAKGYYKPIIGPTLGGGCGTGATRPRVVAELVAPLTLTPGWHLKSKARIARLEAASDDARDRCRISFLSIDVTRLVVEAARSGIAGQLKEIDAKVNAVDLTRQATGWWEHLNTPIRLADGVWLLLRPQQLRLKGVRGEGHLLNVAAGLDAFPAIVTGARPDVVVPPLPRLGNDSGSAGFRVLLDGSVDYATASRALTRELRGKAVTIGRRTVRVASLTAARSVKGRLALSVVFTGDAQGRLQLIGTPRFNRGTNQIAVTDLDFDLTTDSELINAYAWLRSQALLDFFREKARLPGSTVLEQGTRLIEIGLNRKVGDALTLAGKVDSLVVLGAYVTPRGLTVRALVVGKASVAVRQR